MERYADDLDLAQLHIDQATQAAIARIRNQSSSGKGLEECMDCGMTIPKERLIRVPNAKRCIACQERFEYQKAQYLPR